MNVATLPTAAELAQLDPVSLAYLLWQARWTDTARPNQIPPEADPDTGEPWQEFGAMSGRGWGKTQMGAEWLARAAFEDPEGLPSAVICPTFSDVKKTAFNGVSGLLKVIPPELIVDYNKSDFIITMRNVAGGKSTIQGFTAEKPESLRGPNHARVWCDEIAAWVYLEETWDMMEMTLRLGDTPQILWTSTPKPRELIRQLSEPKPGRIIVRGSTYENKANLSAKFLKKVTKYEGTSLGNQEIHGEMLDPEESGIIKRSWFRLWPHDKPLPAFRFIIVSMDTAFTERTIDKKTHDPDPTACAVFGVFEYEKAGQVMLLECWDDYLGFPDLIRRAKKEMKARYGDDAGPVIRPMVGSAQTESSQGRLPDILLIEDKGSGISLRQMLEHEGLFAQAYNPGKQDKLARLHTVSPVFARRRVWLPESAHPDRRGQAVNWCAKLVTQLCSFTGEGSIKNDDYVDATTQCLRLLMDQALLGSLVPTREDRERVAEEDVRRAARGPAVNPYSQ